MFKESKENREKSDASLTVCSKQFTQLLPNCVRFGTTLITQQSSDSEKGYRIQIDFELNMRFLHLSICEFLLLRLAKLARIVIYHLNLLPVEGKVDCGMRVGDCLMVENILLRS